MTTIADPPEGPGVYGLPESPDEASVSLIPVPFDATATFRRGARHAPAAIRNVSEQLDVYDARFGEIWRHGLHMETIPRDLLILSERVTPDADRVYELGEFDDRAHLNTAMVRLDEACDAVRRHVRARCRAAINAGKTPGVIGGEHGVSLGAIEAVGEDGAFGVLQIDAHLDLRPAYLGIEFSHASVMRNALDRVDTLERLVAVGARDASVREWRAAESDDRVRVFPEHTLCDERYQGRTWADQVTDIIDALPERVYVTIDIDGLDPSLCPKTGTPVPGGLSFEQLSYMLERLAGSGKRVVGFDLVEVSPGEQPAQASTIDAIVGARVLYRLCGAAAQSREMRRAKK